MVMLMCRWMNRWQGLLPIFQEDLGFFRADFSRARVGDFDSDLVYEFFKAL